jgi:hypothetical protein
MSPRVPFSFIVCRVLGRSICPFASRFTPRFGRNSDTQERPPRWAGATSGRERVLATSVIRQTGVEHS